MKKKLIAVLLCAAVCLTSGCGSKKSASGADGHAGTSAENAKFTRGRWNENVYTSDRFGFTITLDGGCVKESDEQMAFINGIPDMSDENFNRAVENSGPNSAIYDIIVDYRGGDTLFLAYNKYEGATLDKYVTENANGLRQSENFQDVVIDTVEIAGKSHPCVYSKLVLGGVIRKEIMVMYKSGNYFATVSIGAETEHNFQNMLNNLIG